MIRYSYLWRHEAARGQDEGKDRPCAVLLAVQQEKGGPRVAVAPITHTPPGKDASAIEIPALTKRRLGLDDERSWIITHEVNTFTWPGPDIRPIDAHARKSSFVYGRLPDNMRDLMVGQARERLMRDRGGMIERDEKPQVRDAKKNLTQKVNDLHKKMSDIGKGTGQPETLGGKEIRARNPVSLVKKSTVRSK